MITVEEAWNIIEARKKDYGTELIPFETSLGRVLAEDLKTDRDLPPFNRVAMDGIAIKFDAYQSGLREFIIQGTQGAGVEPLILSGPDQCIEIMTGAAAPDSADTIVRYEDLEIREGMAKVLVENVRRGQNIHFRGKDKKKGEAVAFSGIIISPSIVALAASVGKKELLVKKLPRIIIVSSGDEVVRVVDEPLPYQIRSSNDYAIKAVMQKYGARPDMIHVPDNPEICFQKIQECLFNYDVILLSGGISMGKYDYIPEALEKLSVKKLFHKVMQKPGKPFWFGRHNNGALVFAFPGNPVSTFICVHRYFIPWLETSLGLKIPSIMAELQSNIFFPGNLQYFLLANVQLNEEGKLIANPVGGNGSGDFVQVGSANAFMEFPSKESNFLKGQLFRVWIFDKVI